jgi:hypothetical protein
MSHDGDDVTGMLVAWGQGDQAADSRLIAVVYAAICKGAICADGEVPAAG